MFGCDHWIGEAMFYNERHGLIIRAGNRRWRTPSGSGLEELPAPGWYLAQRKLSAHGLVILQFGLLGKAFEFRESFRKPVFGFFFISLGLLNALDAKSQPARAFHTNRKPIG